MRQGWPQANQRRREVLTLSQHLSKSCTIDVACQAWLASPALKEKTPDLDALVNQFLFPLDGLGPFEKKKCPSAGTSEAIDSFKQIGQDAARFKTAPM